MVLNHLRPVILPFEPGFGHFDAKMATNRTNQTDRTGFTQFFDSKRAQHYPHPGKHGKYLSDEWLVVVLWPFRDILQQQRVCVCVCATFSRKVAICFFWQ